MKKIAITGGIASGKSAACQFFKELGSFVVEADKIGHELLNSDTNLIEQIVQSLGPEILKNGKIDRRVVAEKVFKSRELLEKLEKLLHPRILERIEALYKKACEERKHTFFIAEIPLLFEVGWDTLFDTTILVWANEEKSKLRFKKKSLPPEQYEMRMKRQLTLKEKEKKATYTIQNNGSLKDLKEEIFRLNRNLQTTI